MPTFPERHHDLLVFHLNMLLSFRLPRKHAGISQPRVERAIRFFCCAKSTSRNAMFVVRHHMHNPTRVLLDIAIAIETAAAAAAASILRRARGTRPGAVDVRRRACPVVLVAFILHVGAGCGKNMGYTSSCRGTHAQNERSGVGKGIKKERGDVKSGHGVDNATPVLSLATSNLPATEPANLTFARPLLVVLIRRLVPPEPLTGRIREKEGCNTGNPGRLRRHHRSSSSSSNRWD